jgi:hypothetical protein
MRFIGITVGRWGFGVLVLSKVGPKHPEPQPDVRPVVSPVSPPVPEPEPEPPARTDSDRVDTLRRFVASLRADTQSRMEGGAVVGVDALSLAGCLESVVGDTDYDPDEEKSESRWRNPRTIAVLHPRARCAIESREGELTNTP